VDGVKARRPAMFVGTVVRCGFSWSGAFQVVAICIGHVMSSLELLFVIDLCVCCIASINPLTEVMNSRKCIACRNKLLKRC
jgi:hypothetical protein